MKVEERTRELRKLTRAVTDSPTSVMITDHEGRIEYVNPKFTETSGYRMEEVDFHLEDVLDNLANLVGLKAEEKGLELLFDNQLDAPMAVVGDPLRLGQILTNLGNNAIKFTESGEIVISTRLESSNPRACTVPFQRARHGYRHF